MIIVDVAALLKVRFSYSSLFCSKTNATVNEKSYK